MKTLWNIDTENLAEAVEYFGLQYPVIVSPTDQPWAGKYHGIGCYGPGPDGRVVVTDEPTHFVQVEGSINASWANRVLWHELTHAAQAERYMPEGEVDERGVPRWKAGLRRMTHLYGAESRNLQGFKPGDSLPNLNYTNISFEKEANDNIKHANEVAILVPNQEEEHIWRVDCLKKKDGRQAKTFYIITTDAKTAEEYVKTKYLLQGERWKWDVVSSLTDRPVERDAA